MPTVGLTAGGPAASFDGDVRDLRPVPMDQAQLDLKEETELPDLPEGPDVAAPRRQALLAPTTPVPAPAPITNFRGLGRFDIVTGGQAGSGSPPDTNGDVGPNHYIQSVNSAYAIFDKATGAQLAAFTENSLFSSGSRPGGGTGTGTLCDTNGFGDPIVVYDQFADRWILSNLAFVLNSSTGLWVTPIFQCFAASKTSDPVSGGWWLYAVRIDTGAANQPPVGTLDDYPKFGNWNDGCLYMGANGFNSGGAFSGPIFASLNKADMYAGAPLRGSLTRVAVNESSTFPSNALGRAPDQLPPAGTPNFLVRNATTTSYTIRRFTPGANCGGGGTISATTAISHLTSPNIGSNIIPQPNTTRVLDSLQTRLMQKVQYRRVGGQESVWVTNTARPVANANTRPLWAQLDVTGGTIAPAPVQQGFHDPDATLYRWMGSLAVDTSGDMALGYSTSNAADSNFPSIAYAGRLATDTPGTLGQTETQLVAGGGSQIFQCGGAACARWGDYSSMSVDPVDDCTFWYTSEYYENQAQGSNQPGIWQTRIGSFKFAACVPIHPVITCPADISLDNDPGVCGAAVGFTGARAATATGDPAPAITYSTPSGSVFPVGTTQVTATATNTFGTASCSFRVTVRDAQPPVITAASASPNSLWPPNHKMVPVAVGYTASDNCGVTSALGVTSNEPVNGTGDGDTSPDWLVVDGHHVQLRAERAGGGDGRVYTITVTATDPSGNAATQAVTVTVPHDKGALGIRAGRPERRSLSRCAGRARGPPPGRPRRPVRSGPGGAAPPCAT